MERLTLGEFREFTKDLSDDFEIRVSSIIRGENAYHTNVFDVFSSEDIEDNFVVLEPSEVEANVTDYEDD